MAVAVNVCPKWCSLEEFLQGAATDSRFVKARVQGSQRRRMRNKNCVVVHQAIEIRQSTLILSSGFSNVPPMNGSEYW